MRNVTIVVPVLMTNCQVSLKWNSGPVTIHTAMTQTSKDEHSWPTAEVRGRLRKPGVPSGVTHTKPLFGRLTLNMGDRRGLPAPVVSMEELALIAVGLCSSITAWRSPYRL